MTTRSVRAIFFGLLALLLLPGCTGVNRLADYSFEETKVAVVANIPPRPQVFTDTFFDTPIHPQDPIGSIFRAGSAIIKYSEMQEAQRRMDSALAYVDVADLIARRTLSKSADLLGYQPVSRVSEADYVLDIRVEEYGLLASSWDAAVEFQLKAEVLLSDRRTRKLVWRRKVHEAEPVSQAFVGMGATFGNVYTAVSLSKLSVEEMIAALEHLADYTADRFVQKLRHDYYKR